jgi:hypothetical protein
MPVKVEYPNVDYTVQEDQLFIGDKAFKGAKPTLLKYLEINTSKIDKVIKLESLSKETQDYILNKNKSPQESENGQPQKPAEIKRTALPQRGIKRSTIRHRNIDAELEMRPEDSYKEGTERNSLSKYPFNSLYKNILTEDEYNNLAEYVNGMAKQPFTKEYWESLSEEEKDKHIKFDYIIYNYIFNIFFQIPYFHNQIFDYIIYFLKYKNKSWTKLTNFILS